MHWCSDASQEKKPLEAHEAVYLKLPNFSSALFQTFFRSACWRIAPPEQSGALRYFHSFFRLFALVWVIGFDSTRRAIRGLLSLAAPVYGLCAAPCKALSASHFAFARRLFFFSYFFAAWFQWARELSGSSIARCCGFCAAKKTPPVVFRQSLRKTFLFSGSLKEL